MGVLNRSSINRAYTVHKPIIFLHKCTVRYFTMHIHCSNVFIGMEVILVRHFVKNVSKGNEFYIKTIAVRYGTVRYRINCLRCEELS